MFPPRLFLRRTFGGSSVAAAAMAEAGVGIAEYLHDCRAALLAEPGRKLHIVIGNEVRLHAQLRRLHWVAPVNAGRNAGDDVRLHAASFTQAADADSIVSAVTLAYFHHLKRAADDAVLVVPVACIPAEDVELRRDAAVLLQKAGMDIR